MKSSLVTIRLKLMAVMIEAIAIPILATGYFMMKQAEDSLLREKEARLYAIAGELDRHLEGSFRDLLNDSDGMDREAAIRALNHELQPLTDRVAQGNPGVGVGYYSKEWDAVVTYGPSDPYRDKIGIAIGEHHPGRQVMKERVPQVYTGSQVRGDIMNAMVPLLRGQEVIGYVWANELTSDVQFQLNKMRKNILWILVLGAIIGMLAVILISNRFGGRLDRMIASIKKMENNVAYRLPMVGGELGRIPIAVNRLIDRLLELKGHTEVIVSSVCDGIITVDNEGKVTEWNDAAVRITGYSREEMIGSVYGFLFSEEARRESALLQTLHTGQVFASVDFHFPSKSGEKIPVNCSTALLEGPSGHLMGAAVVFRDLRERIKWEEQIRRTDQLRALGELAAGMAHEIRNPLTSIKAFSQIMEQGLDPDEPNRDYLGIIIKETDRMNRLVEQLLLFGKPSIHDEREWNLPEVLEQSLLLVEHDLRKKSVQITKQLESAPMMIDFHLLQQIMINLLLNAVQAIEARGRLEMRTFRDHSRVGFSIFNSGSPIGEDVREEIFRPFFTKKPQGVGLGLSVTQNIVQLYRGRITFDNVEDGVRFQVEFPIGKEEKDGEDSGRG
ncbi:histidine kinase dimerization/phospho-acceptor domain-containing protein [Ammoniphilus sp. 3BR4]|uniref:histidine kinase dimerization/phospho-acceptor domain-containing protein n=1 Tax=Ammoniphilus sp. 3BR4 TaxID=3158265 RepID=UPI003465C35C